MRTEMIIRVQTEKGGHCKAIKVAAAIQGVESVTIAGEDRNLLLVIGVGIDSNRITEKLRRKVGHAEVVELRTVDLAGADDHHQHLGGGLISAADHARAYRYQPSPGPYKQHASARDHYYAAAPDGGYYTPQDQYYTNGGSAMGGARGYYYGGAGGGYPAQYQQQQHDYVHHPASMRPVEYASDPNSCSVM